VEKSPRERCSKEFGGGKVISWKMICFYTLMSLFAFPLVHTASAQTLLQITSPTPGLPIYFGWTEGQTYTITLAADPSVSNIFVTTESPLPAAQPTSNPLQFTLTLPTNITPGIYSIGAVGYTSSGDVEADPVPLDIERADLPVSLTVQPPSIQLQGVGDSTPISVWGTFADGTALLLSNSTELTYNSNNQAIATVSGQLFANAQGTLPPIAPLTATAVGVGQTTSWVSIWQGSKLITTTAFWITVVPPLPSGPAPVITSVSTTTGTPGVTQVTVNGSNFGSAEGSGYVELGSMSATTIGSWTPNQIVATVPLGSMPGVVEVKQNGLASNDIPFTTVVPSITGLSTATGTTGTPVTISGANFGTTQGGSSVMFNRAAAAPTSWAGGSIVAPVPAAATTGNIVVLVNGTPSNAVGFTATPTISNLQPPQAAIGAPVTINGSNFGTAQNTSTVTFNGVGATPTSWGTGAIGVPVPSGATTGPVVVTVNGVASNASTFTLSGAPYITGLSPSSGAVSASVTISGSGFGSRQGSSTVTFNQTKAKTFASWAAGSITVSVPSGATTGNIVVTVGGVASNGVSFTVVPAPHITKLSVTSGPVGTAVTITGTNFGSPQGSGTVTFNGTAATTITSWSATSIVTAVPTGATTGNVVVNASGVASNGVKFTVN
jgi:IPT/TIG domain